MTKEFNVNIFYGKLKISPVRKLCHTMLVNVNTLHVYKSQIIIHRF